MPVDRQQWSYRQNCGRFTFNLCNTMGCVYLFAQVAGMGVIPRRAWCGYVEEGA